MRNNALPQEERSREEGRGTMKAANCLFCSADITEGRQLCPICERVLAPYKDILRAALDRTPVEFRGDKYGCISAFIIRTRASHLKGLKKRYIIQVELMSSRTHSVIYADPKEITVLRDWRPPNE